MTWRITAALIPALFLGACVYHVDTAIPEGQSTFDPALVGTWVTESDTAVVSAGQDGAYDIQYTDDKGERVRLEGRAGKLGQRTILEVTPLLTGDETGDWPVARLLLVVSVSGAEARTQLINAAAMRAAVARDPAGLPHIRRGDNVILTAPTAQLSPALRAFIERPGALDDPATWRRIGPRGATDAIDGVARNASDAVRQAAAMNVTGMTAAHEGGRSTRSVSCALYRGLDLLGSAAAGVVVGQFTARVIRGDRARSRNLEHGFMAGGALLGVHVALRDPAPPLVPRHCHRRGVFGG